MVALAIFLTLAYLLTGGEFLQPKTTIYMYVRDATGLSVDSPVRVDGIGVGKVLSLSLTGSRDPLRAIRVAISVTREHLDSIPADSSAQLSTDTLIGDKFVDITSGRDPNHVPPGGEIRFKDQPELMKSLDLSDFQKELRTVDATLTEIERGQGLVGQFVKGEEVYDSLLKELGDFRKQIHTITTADTALRQALYTDEMYRQIRDPIVELDRNLATIQSGQGPLGEWFRDTARYQQLRAQATDLHRAIVDLRSSEFFKSDAQYQEWNRMVAALIRSVDEINADPSLNRTDVYESINGMTKELGATLKDFRQHPSKYLRLKVF